MSGYENDCHGCNHPDRHGCVAPDEECFGYCTSCAVALSADCAELQAAWYPDQLKSIADVNPTLLLDVIKGAMAFDAALRLVRTGDPRPFCELEPDPFYYGLCGCDKCAAIWAGEEQR
ncbi:MAG: hypothetical protein ACM4D3_18335 [Candidatus Sericytochromatia bacterium]